MMKKLTIEYLAVHTHQEFQDSRKKMRQGFQAVTETLDLIRHDLIGVKNSLSLLASTIGSEVGDLRRRVERLERKAGLSK